MDGLPSLLQSITPSATYWSRKRSDESQTKISESPSTITGLSRAARVNLTGGACPCSHPATCSDLLANGTQPLRHMATLPSITKRCSSVLEDRKGHNPGRRSPLRLGFLSYAKLNLALSARNCQRLILPHRAAKPFHFPCVSSFEAEPGSADACGTCACKLR